MGATVINHYLDRAAFALAGTNPRGWQATLRQDAESAGVPYEQALEELIEQVPDIAWDFVSPGEVQA